MKNKDLKEGVIFSFNNEEYCNLIESDNIRGGYIGYNKMFNIYIIHFNGINIYSSKTFKASEKRLKILFTKWSLQFI